MFERDYLMRMFIDFAIAIRKSWELDEEEKDPAGSADLLEDAVGSATEIDGATLLSLAPESIAAVLQVSGTDPRVIEYVARSLLLSAQYRAEAHQAQLAALRERQAYALADAYGIDLTPLVITKESFEELFGRQDEL